MPSLGRGQLSFRGTGCSFEKIRAAISGLRKNLRTAVMEVKVPRYRVGLDVPSRVYCCNALYPL